MVRLWSSLLLLAAALSAACGSAKGASSSEKAVDPAAVPVTTVAAVERPITRFIRVTGTFAAEEQADVAAETQGRVVATPVERGTQVAAGADLIRISPAEASAQAAEAEANAAQIESRLAIAEGGTFDIDRVPEVANARATLTLAQGDYDRAKMLFEKKLLSQAEFDQRSAQAEVARRQYDIARNAAVQQYQALLGARARVTLARKALADTVVRAPFTGVVGERLVSVGDYVTRGTKVVSVMRTNPLRVQLTVPQQFSVEVGVGRAVTLEVDTAPGKSLHGPGALRVARAPGRLAHADRRGGREQPRRLAQARVVRDGADRAGRQPARRAGAGRVGADRVGDVARVRRGRRPRRGAARDHRTDGGRSRRDHDRTQDGRTGRRDQREPDRRMACAWPPPQVFRLVGGRHAMAC